MTALITLTPIDPGTDTRVTVRLCATQNPADTGADGQVWWPAVLTQPVIQTRLFDGDFTSAVDSGSASIEVALGVLIRALDPSGSGKAFPRVERYDWAGAGVTIQRRNGAALQTLAVMKVDTFSQDGMRLALRFAAATELFDAKVLSATYAGTGGAEGGADLKGQVKPLVFGRARNLEPVFIDQIDNVFQVSGYGPVQAISAVYERGSSFGASVGNFANYAALVAATIPPGRWATCLAQGMIRLGAPPAGVITADVDGDNTAGFLRRTGAILQEIGSRLALSANINATSFAALDTAVARNVNIAITEQTSFMELVQRMVAPCNAMPGIGPDGRLLVSRVAFGVEQFTLDAKGREMPPVLGMVRQNTSAPYKRIQMGAARSWRVHSFDEIAFYSDLIDRGLYDAATVYREGNIVSKIDKSRWLYINATPTAGNAPPTWPTTSNAWWDNMDPPANQDPTIANDEVILPGLATSLPGTGAFDGQMIATTDTGEVYRWNKAGLAWIRVSDITAVAQREVVPQFPIIEIRQGEPGSSGSRAVLHAAKRGTDSLLGGTYSLVSSNLGAGSASINAGTGTGTFSGIVQSGNYKIRYTHSDGLATDAVVNVTFIPSGTPSTSSDGPVGLSNISGSSFVPIGFRNLRVTPPTGVTSVALTAQNVDLALEAALPLGSTTVEMRWMVRPVGGGSFTAVGSVATSSPSPEVEDSGLVDGLGNPIPTTQSGTITCNRTATGLTSGVEYEFQPEARISAGNIRTVYISGTGAAAA